LQKHIAATKIKKYFFIIKIPDMCRAQHFSCSYDFTGLVQFFERYSAPLSSVVFYRALAACTQRPSGLAQRRDFRTTFLIRTSARRCAKPQVICWHFVLFFVVFVLLPALFVLLLPAFATLLLAFVPLPALFAVLLPVFAMLLLAFALLLVLFAVLLVLPPAAFAMSPVAFALLLASFAVLPASFALLFVLFAAYSALFAHWQCLS
jgi:hypothetical protein